MSAFITRFEPSGNGPVVAVKDLIDIEGAPTTAGCRAVAVDAAPAEHDAACLAGFRSAGSRIVGKTNLDELASLVFGPNPWFGNPVNPIDPGRITGGSSGGSASAVASGDAEIALGTDTGGSIRIPAACCGIAGLKTTHGRIPVEGVWPLAPSFDTVGPLAADVRGLETAMRLLDPGFGTGRAAQRIGRLATGGTPQVEESIDSALKEAGLDVVAVGDGTDLQTGRDCFTTIYFCELWRSDAGLLGRRPEGVGEVATRTIRRAERYLGSERRARSRLAVWSAEIESLFDRFDALAAPTLPILPPFVEDLASGHSAALVAELTRHTSVFNASGLPCTAQPVPLGSSHLPASLQLVGPRMGEEMLLATAALVESAVGR